LIAEIKVASTFAAISKLDKLMEKNIKVTRYCELQGVIRVYDEGLYQYPDRTFKKDGYDFNLYYVDSNQKRSGN